MSDTPKNRPEAHDTPPRMNAALFVLGTAADTTWRMFVPTVGLMSLGYFADQYFSSKPWLFVLGLIIGLGVAGLLVKKQFEKTS